MRLATFTLLILGALASGGGHAYAQCTVAGASCDDGEYCTVGDTCNSSLVCTGSSRSCSDGDPCTDDVCNESADRCDHPPAPMGTSCNDGEFCTSPDRCDGSGSCRPGPPRDCDDGRDCTTDSCDELGDSCVNDLDADACVIRGECYVEGDRDPRGSDPCEQCIPGISTNRFSEAPPGTTCGVAACAGGVLTAAPECDTTGACIPGATSTCESGACRDVTSCTGCSLDTHCAAGEWCSGTGCAPVLDQGEPCPRGAACATGNCVDGVCCDGPCDGPCRGCAMSDAVGTCMPHPALTDPEGGCGVVGCDGMGECRPSGDAAVDAGGGDGGGLDTGVIGPDGGNALTAHGSGCVACSLASQPESDGRGLLGAAVVGLLVALRRRARGRRTRGRRRR